MHEDLDLAYMDGFEMARKFNEGSLSPTEVHDAVQAVIEAREPFLNAISDRRPEVSRADALSSSERWQRGEPLSAYDGVPITIKEAIARAGIPMSFGNAGVKPHLPDRSAPSVLRAERAGLVVVASTVMPDWGMLSSGLSSRFGVTRSPLNLDWTTGGSSSGAGAAAAGGYGPLHVGTDIGGSIRLPGAWLGLAALKPSHGRIALHNPYLGRAAGPMTRTVRDAAAVMKILSGQDPVDHTSVPSDHVSWEDLTWEPRGSRIGLLTDAGCGGSTRPAIIDSVQKAAKMFEAAGAEIVPIEPLMDQDLLDDLDLFWRVRSWVDYRALDQESRNRVLPYVASWCTAGSDVSGARVLECYQSTMEVARRTVAATEPYDLILSPVAPVAAFSAEKPMPFAGDHATMHHIGYTAPFNMSGQPAMSVNCGFTGDGRTIGVQIAGRRFDDRGVLRAAQWYESARGSLNAPRWPQHEIVPEPWNGRAIHTRSER